MDDFEAQDAIENLEKKVDILTQKLSDFTDGFNARMSTHFSTLIDVISEKPSEYVTDKSDYIIKLLCSLGYGQACILENQRKIVELLGGRNVGIRSISMEEKQRRIERTLNEMEDPYRRKNS